MGKSSGHTVQSVTGSSTGVIQFVVGMRGNASGRLHRGGCCLEVHLVEKVAQVLSRGRGPSKGTGAQGTWLCSWGLGTRSATFLNMY